MKARLIGLRACQDTSEFRAARCCVVAPQRLARAKVVAVVVGCLHYAEVSGHLSQFARTSCRSEIFCLLFTRAVAGLVLYAKPDF